jgi:hypothetical protein
MRLISLILVILLVTGSAFADSAKRKPIRIPAEEAPRILKIGELAGTAQVCGIGWANYYISFYKSERRKGIWTDAQLKNITAIFSYAQAKAVRETKSCPPSMKNKIEAKIIKRTSIFEIIKET